MTKRSLNEQSENNKYLETSLTSSRNIRFEIRRISLAKMNKKSRISQLTRFYYVNRRSRNNFYPYLIITTPTRH